METLLLLKKRYYIMYQIEMLFQKLEKLSSRKDEYYSINPIITAYSDLSDELLAIREINRKVLIASELKLDKKKGELEVLEGNFVKRMKKTSKTLDRIELLLSDIQKLKRNVRACKKTKETFDFKKSRFRLSLIILRRRFTTENSIYTI